MVNRFAFAAAWGLALLVGVTAPAQTNNQGGQSKDQQGSESKSDQGGQTKSQQGDTQRQDAGQAQGQAETIRGELAGVTVLGETMVDHDTGRGVLAELTYLTILGSPAGAGRQGGRGGQAGSGGDDARRGEQNQNEGARSESKNQGTNREQADRERGVRGRLGEMFANRRSVYHIAVGSETQVRHRSLRDGRGQDSGDQKGDQAREPSQAALEQLQLGDRVEVEFSRINARGPSGTGGEGQAGSASRTRHGRHRIIRGVAKTITILSVPDRDGDRDDSENRKDGDPSSREKPSSSDSQGKDSDRDK